MTGKKSRNFGEKLRALREEFDVSIQQMHIGTGFARSTIHKWEQNKCFPSLYNMIQVANFFKVDLSYFEDETADPYKRITQELQDMSTRIQRLEKIIDAYNSTPGHTE